MMAAGDVTVCVVVGQDTKAGAATARAARSWLASLAAREPVTVVLDPGMNPAGQLTVGFDATAGEALDRAARACRTPWMLALLPGDRLAGDPAALAAAVNSDAVAVELERPSTVVPNPLAWPPHRLVRVESGRWEGTLAPAWKSEGRFERLTTVRVRTKPQPDSLLAAWWALLADRHAADGSQESRTAAALALYHAGWGDAAVVRLWKIVRTAVDDRARGLAARQLVPIAMAAGRVTIANRALVEWIAATGEDRSNLSWRAVNEMARDRFGVAYAAITAAQQARSMDEDPMTLDDTVLASLKTAAGGTLRIRQHDALRFREVLKTTSGERQQRAASSLVGAWATAGLGVEDLYKGLTPDQVRILDVALISVPAIDPEAWLATVETALDHLEWSDRAAERIQTAAASLGLEEATKWGARLRAVGLDRWCPVTLIAREHIDLFDRALAAATCNIAFGQDMTPALRAAATEVATERLPLLVKKLTAISPELADVAADAAATSPRRAAAVGRAEN
jgi:hypothetical protein